MLHIPAWLIVIATNMFFQMTVGFVAATLLVLRKYGNPIVVYILSLLAVVGLLGSIHMLDYAYDRVPRVLGSAYLAIPLYQSCAVARSCYLLFRLAQKRVSIQEKARMWVSAAPGNPRPLREAVEQIRAAVEKERHPVVSRREVRRALIAAGYPNESGRRKVKPLPKYDPMKLVG